MYALSEFIACYRLVGTCTCVCVAFRILEVIEQFITSQFPGIMVDAVTMVIVSHMHN